MKTTQYVRQEKAIAVADSGGIWQRWIWGLRLLRDVEAMSSPKSLRHGVSDQLIAAANASGLKLSAREIQARLQCARAYPTEAQIRRSTADFEHWSALVQAGFPAYEAPDGEPLADHRTEAERVQDRARAIVDLIGSQGTLFPLRDFEPTATTLGELVAYAEQQEELTARFVAHGRKRRAYLEASLRRPGRTSTCHGPTRIAAWTRSPRPSSTGRSSRRRDVPASRPRHHRGPDPAGSGLAPPLPHLDLSADEGARPR